MRYGTLLTVLVAVSTLAGCAATSSSGRPASYHYQMGVSFLEERNYTAALTDLSEAEKLDPDNAELQYNLGRALTGKRRLDLAEQRYLRALALRPKYSEARNDLGVLYLETGRWDNAIQQFRAVKDDLFYPRHDHALINLGLAYLGKGDYSAALEELYTARSADPRNPIVKVAIGRVLFGQGKTQQAVQEYRRAIEIAPDYAQAHFQLGLALMKESQLAAARAAFKEVVRIAPDSEIGHTAIGYIDLLR
ncbi:tetratricopeptide repeat protein [Trichlorobacter lovleyi]|uniref:tetratricopeptide repeat protein n=1 Tax=Trichlorobacter lovleyi TaxID=313985 RepID=UPI00223FD957|nr:tetratricopeptide repeat protein [Trichlorobacter lovleyi]QOX80566.1 tetratricopeptide repeat protein [Trichlorobacter lovleyi]